MIDPTRSAIRKIGSSCGIIIPAQVLRAYDLKRGDGVVFDVRDEKRLAIYKDLPTIPA